MSKITDKTTNVDNDVDTENKLLKEQAIKFEEMFASMQKQIEALQKPVEVTMTEAKTEVEKSMVYIGSNIMEKTIISTNKDGSSGVTLYGHKKPIGVTFNKMSNLLENDKIRILFEKGLLYFADKKWYETFSVDTKIILNDDSITSLLGSDSNSLVAQLMEITENKTNSTLMHCLLFRIAYLLKNNQVTNFDFNNMQTLKNFFSVDIASIMRLLELKENS